MSEKDLVKEFEKEFDKRDCYEYSCEARDCCECHTYQDAFEEFKKERENNFGQLKVSVAFQNHFADILYNKAQHAIYEWLGKHTIPADIWSELIQAVDNALYESIKECMNNNGTLVELFSDVSKSIYIKQYSKGYLKSWSKDQLIEHIECLQHNCAVANETNYNQAQYFDKCVADEVQKRLKAITDSLRELVLPLTPRTANRTWNKAILYCVKLLEESDKSE